MGTPAPGAGLPQRPRPTRPYRYLADFTGCA
jgi:hypothetical protein